MGSIEIRGVEGVSILEVAGNLTDDREIDDLRMAVEFLIDKADARKVIVDIKRVLILSINFLHELARLEIEIKARDGEIVLVDSPLMALEHRCFHMNIKVPVFYERKKALVHFLII